MRQCVLIAAACLLLASTAAQAQWWPFAPRDYEECAAQVEKSAGKSNLGKEARASQLAECDAKFAGRRKPGGGYTYYDFMQDRHFDIAGPNPTPEELKRFDQEYTVYLERQRHDAIVAALADKQRQQSEAAELRSPLIEKIEKPAPRSIVAARPAAPPRRPVISRASQVSRPRCDTRLSCTWTDFSEGVRNFFGGTPKSRPPARI